MGVDDAGKVDRRRFAGLRVAGEKSHHARRGFNHGLERSLGGLQVEERAARLELERLQRLARGQIPSIDRVRSGHRSVRHGQGRRAVGAHRQSYAGRRCGTSACPSMARGERRKAHAAGLGAASRARSSTAADTPTAVAADAQYRRELK